ncbi:dienelactone hydrolase family protein [Chitiniphilus eburneus]|uniref:Dienelactone hydrolase family protein n=1 Tax=Chitiniphilus eburneus TaxID=2571148 RepID=A0A4V5MRV7_9NEIS|nr:dienelactone hydrolase family protein [Chitiniphilus eburneus]TJZ77618.1 dienelactone hydrolase family protein [Chitiniphilus eburneus]
MTQAPTPGGFAHATTPVTATLIVTDDADLETGDIRLDDIDAYYARPQGEGPFPVVLIAHEIFGVHEHIRDVVRRFAKAGYLAVAPELFQRQGDVRQLAGFEQIRPVVAQVPDDQVFADLDAALDWAIAHGGDAARVAMTGFCWGGRIAWLYAARQPRLRAVVAWYGRLVGEVTANQPRFPADVVQALKAPVLGLYGGADTSIPQDTVAPFQAALAASGGASEVHVYPEAGHAFYADYRPSYHAEAARDGWQRTLEWFRRHGV